MNGWANSTHSPSVAFWCASATFAAATLTALASLTLEQVPSFRGTMMSLNQSLQAIGAVAGLTISGLLLDLYANNFQILYSMFGVFGIASATVVFALAKDTVKSQWRVKTQDSLQNGDYNPEN